MALKDLYSFNSLPDNGKCPVTLPDSNISKLSRVTTLVTKLMNKHCLVFCSSIESVVHVKSVVVGAVALTAVDVADVVSPN